MGVVAYALAGRIDIDFEEILGYGTNNTPIKLADIWPTKDEISGVMNCINKQLYQEVYKNINQGSSDWQQLNAVKSDTYNWDSASTYVARPPFFKGLTKNVGTFKKIESAPI